MNLVIILLMDINLNKLKIHLITLAQRLQLLASLEQQ